MVGALVMLGGVPGVVLGGRLADRYATRIRGARMAIPGYCVLAGNALFLLSWLHLPLWPTFVIQVAGFFVVALSVPALRAGLSDAVPANLRGAGFGFFNLASVVFGQAAAPLIVFALSGAFDDNLRTAFLLVSPPVFVGGFVLLKARNHLDADAAKIFEAILRAMQEQEEKALAGGGAEAGAGGSVEGDAERVGDAGTTGDEQRPLGDDGDVRPQHE